MVPRYHSTICAWHRTALHHVCAPTCFCLGTACRPEPEAAGLLTMAAAAAHTRSPMHAGIMLAGAHATHTAQHGSWLAL